MQTQLPEGFDHAITKKAMLVSLTIKMPSTGRKDKEASKEVTESHHADEESAYVSKKLYNKELVAGFKSVATECRKIFYEMTLNWGRDGTRILLATSYFKLIESLKEKENRFWQEAEVFLDRVEEAEEKERHRLGTLYKEDDYLSRDQLRDKFAFELSFLPLTDSADWRINLSREEQERIKEQTRAQMTQAYQTAMRDPWLRLKGVIDKMAESLGDPEKRFHGTLVTNIEDLCEVLPSLNLTGDKMLDELVSDVRKRLTMYSADELRKDPNARSVTAQEAAKLARRVDEYAGLL